MEVWNATTNTTFFCHDDLPATSIAHINHEVDVDICITTNKPRSNHVTLNMNLEYGNEVTPSETTDFETDKNIVSICEMYDNYTTKPSSYASTIVNCRMECITIVSRESIKDVSISTQTSSSTVISDSINIQNKHWPLYAINGKEMKSLRDIPGISNTSFDSTYYHCKSNGPITHFSFNTIICFYLSCYSSTHY